MEILGPASSPLAPQSSVVTIGVYDGVHLGHRRTLARMLDLARSTDRSAVVATFDRHPLDVVRPAAAPKLLADLGQRLELLEEVGIDAVAVIPFDEERAAESAEDFVASVLVELLGASTVVVGDGFRFGRDRLGDIDMLERLGAVLGFDVERVTLGEADGDRISSTRIRALLAEGDVEAAAELLGRVHELRGAVAHGDGRGGPLLGFPTANIHVDERMAIPATGIYAGWYRDDELGAHPAAISVGRRPTFYASADPLIEAHLLDFDGDLYGRDGRISFLARLRDEERYEQLDELIAQMTRDADAACAACEANRGLAPH